MPFVKLLACSSAAWLLGWLASRGMRKASPATQHLLWLLVFVITAAGSLVALVPTRWEWAVLPPRTAAMPAAPIARGAEPAPAFPRTLPEPAVQVAPVGQAVQAAGILPEAAPSRFAAPWRTRFCMGDSLVKLAWAGWGMGVLAGLGVYAASVARLRGIRKRAVGLEMRLPLGEALMLAQKRAALARAVPAYLSDEVSVPLVTGVLRPVMIFPRVAALWSREQMDAVLFHELAHLARHDLLSAFFSRMVLVVHWFNPLLWLALRRLRIEAEQAADDEAAGRYGRAEDYAENLVAMVRELKAARMNLVSAIGMESHASLEGRIRRLLSAVRNSRVPSARHCVSAIAAAALLVLAIGLIRPVAAEGTATPTSAAKASHSTGPFSILYSADGVERLQEESNILGASRDFSDKVERVAQAMQKLSEACDHSQFTYTSGEVAASGLSGYYKRSLEIQALLGKPVEPSPLAAATEGQAAGRDHFKERRDEPNWWLEEEKEKEETDFQNHPELIAYGEEKGGSYWYESRKNLITVSPEARKPVPTSFSEYLTKRISGANTAGRPTRSLEDCIRNFGAEGNFNTIKDNITSITLENQFLLGSSSKAAALVYRYVFEMASPNPYLKSFTLLRRPPASALTNLTGKETSKDYKSDYALSSANPVTEVEFKDYKDTGKGFSLPSTIVVKDYAALPTGMDKAVLQQPESAQEVTNYHLLTRTLTLNEAQWTSLPWKGFVETFAKSDTVIEKSTTQEGTSEKDATVATSEMTGGAKRYEGVVLDDAGNPVAGAKVRVDPSEFLLIENGSVRRGTAILQGIGQTDREGRFSLYCSGTKGVIYVEHAKGSGWAKLSGFTGEVRLQPWGAIEGVLLLNGVAQPNCRVEVMQDIGQPNLALLCSGKTDEQGRFKFDRVTPGLSSLNVQEEPPIYGMVAKSRRVGLMVESGKTVEIELGRNGAEVIGQVVWPAEPQLPDESFATAYLMTKAPPGAPKYPYPVVKDGLEVEQYFATEAGRADLRNRYAFSAIVGKNGSFHFNNVPAGEYTLVIRQFTGRGGSNIGHVSTEVSVSQQDQLEDKKVVIPPVALTKITLPPEENAPFGRVMIMVYDATALALAAKEHPELKQGLKKYEANPERYRTSPSIFLTCGEPQSGPLPASLLLQPINPEPAAVVMLPDHAKCYVERTSDFSPTGEANYQVRTDIPGGGYILPMRAAKGSWVILTNGNLTDRTKAKFYLVRFDG